MSRAQDMHLPHCYTTYCDPRLNYAQSMEVAFMMTAYLNKLKAGPRMKLGVDTKRTAWTDLLVDEVPITPKLP